MREDHKIKSGSVQKMALALAIKALILLAYLSTLPRLRKASAIATSAA